MTPEACRFERKIEGLAPHRQLVRRLAPLRVSEDKRPTRDTGHIQVN
jgi:hypothetical protein